MTGTVTINGNPSTTISASTSPGGWNNGISTTWIRSGTTSNSILFPSAIESATGELEEALDELIRANLPFALTSPIEITRTRAVEIHKEIQKKAAIEKIKEKLSEEEQEILGI